MFTPGINPDLFKPATAHTSSMPALREPVTTVIRPSAPRPLRKGDAVTVHDYLGGRRAGIYLSRDGENRSFVEVAGMPVTMFDYLIYRA